MSFEKPQLEAEETIENGAEKFKVPEALKSYWGFVAQLKDTGKNPSDPENYQWLKSMTDHLAKEDIDFAEVLATKESDALGMMDALEEYSNEFTEKQWKTSESRNKENKE
jgi:hypothetical protein